MVVGVRRRQEAVAVVGLQFRAFMPDRSGVYERGGHLDVEVEEIREEAGSNEMRRKEEEARGEIKCLS